MKDTLLLNDDMLWDYADGFLDAAEKQRVENYLRQHPEWQARLDTILAQKRELFSLPLESPDTGFADRVMAAWAAEQVHVRAQQAKGKDWMIWLIAAVFGLFLITPVVVMVLAAFQLPAEQLPSVALPEMPAIDWALWADNPFLQYGLLFTAVLLVLRFLDKFLQHRRMAHDLGY